MCIYVYVGSLLTLQFTINPLHNVYSIGAPNMERLPIFELLFYNDIKNCSQNWQHAETRMAVLAWINKIHSVFLIADCSCKIDYKMILIGNYTLGEIFIIQHVLPTHGVIKISLKLVSFFINTSRTV